MKKNGVVFLIVWLISTLTAHVAFADTDYRCLNKCVNKGNNRALCLQECAYEGATPSVPVVRGSALSNPNKQFDVPVPALNVPAPKPKETTPARKDYKCTAACLREGMQYSFCEEKCGKKPENGLVLEPQ